MTTYRHSYNPRTMKKGTVLETHKYASELNKIIRWQGHTIQLAAKHATTIKEARTLLFPKPHYSCKKLTVAVNVPGHTKLNRTYGGIVCNTAAALHYLRDIRKRHNLPETTFKVIIQQVMV